MRKAGITETNKLEKTGSGRYRYGFNGKEHESEAKGWQNQVDYGIRVYDPRVGRFLSVDPLTQSYPWYTPYQFAGNKPIIAIDLDGEEEKIVIHHLAKYNDGTFYVKSTDVTIDHNSMYVDGEGNRKAITNVYAEYEGQTSLIGFREEDVKPGGLKPSAAYDYTDESGSMRQKERDDNDYAGSYWNVGKWWEITKRDLNAPDNTLIIQDVSALGEILASQAAAALKRIKSERLQSTPKPPSAKRQQLLDSKKSYEKLIKDHKKRLEEFKKDPLGKSGKKWLETATKDNPTKETLLKRARGRIPALEKQIKKQEGELKKINEALKTTE